MKMGHVDLVEGRFVGWQPYVEMLPQVIELSSFILTNSCAFSYNYVSVF